MVGFNRVFIASCGPPGVQRNKLPARCGFDGALGDLLGDPVQPLPACHLGPDVLGIDASLRPEHDQIVHQVRALLDHSFGLAVERVDHNLDRLLGNFLGHFGAARAQQPRGARRGGICFARRQHGLIEAIDRITHATQHNAERRADVLTSIQRRHKR